MLDASSNHQGQSYKTIKTTKVIYPQVYSYTLPEVPANDGSQKIGYTERRNVDSRIDEQVNTAAIRLTAHKLWSAPAFFSDRKTAFKDKDFHRYLQKSGVEKRDDLGTEWFYFGDIPEKSKQLFDKFRDGGFTSLQSPSGKLSYKLRVEQQQAVDQALEYFNNHEKGEFLWNAKPRFGKTLASYDLAKKLGARKVLIVTNRPAIANSWFDDFEMFVDGYVFISETSSLNDRPTVTREQFLASNMDDSQITFLSLQDLKGSKFFGGEYNKLEWIADLNWDLLIVDEAHEGIDTTRTDAAFDIIKCQYVLHLSGTPFKQLANNKFTSDAIFNWTYLDEQRVKKSEIEESETGDHTDLPDLRLFTYRISQMVADEINEGIEIDDQNRDYAFDLNEFFATENKKFKYEADIKAFLKNLTTNTKYPFSTPELRNQLKHTFWFVGNRVDSVKALEQLLKQDEVFKDYEIVVAAGDGRTFEEEERDFKANERSFDRVKKAIKENDKTITLSCGQLTTGVTIKEWSAVLMLTDIKAPAQYMQAAFRSQNPYRYTDENGNIAVKQSAYLFDFAPTRVLELYDQFANALNPKAVNGEITEAERKDNIKELLNYFPVISEDVNGRMIELDAEKVLTFPNALAATEIVQSRFMTNLLFNDNIKGVFHFPKEVEDILNKMPVEKNKRAEKSKTKLDLDDARQVEADKTTKINQNSNVILGEKIYKANIDRIVDGAIKTQTSEGLLDSLSEQVMDSTEPLIKAYKDAYKVANAEIEEIKQDTKEKIQIEVAEYESAEVKDPQALKDNLIRIIERDFVATKVEEQETEKVEQVQKTKEEEVREHLRAFTRTIPMFIMANSATKDITIDNFDLEISDEDFEDLTNITKEEFHKLRDGFDYEEDGQRKTFGGVFDRYKFNASIAEFVAEKSKRADYFKTDDDIFELIPNQKNNQIFTPRNVVKMMVDGLEKESPDLFKRPDSTFIDLYMKSGMYITEIVKKLVANTGHLYPNEAACVKHILENQVYGLAPTGVLHDITKSYIFGFDNDHKISAKNFAQHDLLPEAKDGTAKEKLAELFNEGKEMKFDAVVGNPPYQDQTVGRSTQMPPIYNYFMDASYGISDRSCLITPARFLFNAGATPSAWNKKMLNDKSLKVVTYEQNSAKIFPSTDIKGGVAITFRSVFENFGKIGTFTVFNELNTILHKVESAGEKSFSSIVFSAFSYQFSKQLHQEKPDVKNRLSDGHENDISTGIFEQLPDVFLERKPDDSVGYIQMYGLSSKQRVYRWVKKTYVRNHPNLEKYKVWVPKANGSGAIGEVLSTPLIGTPLIGTPLIGTTHSFISIGAFDTLREAENALKYVKTRFARTMLGVLKITQDNPPAKWEKVPLQDFTKNSDIDWSKSISEIDQQLYKKYNLSQEEIDFIETKVKAME